MRALAEYLSLPGAEHRVALWSGEPLGRQSPPDLYDLYMHAWAARQVFRLNPRWLLDIGSGKPFVSILSQFCAVTTLDIDPWACNLTGLEVAYGDVAHLPYEDGTIRYVTCLSVCEHVGLGRYGDALAPLGSLKAFQELSRIVAPSGHLILSLPIGRQNGVVFPAHRIFRREDVLGHLPAFRVERETCLYPEPGPVERVSELAEWGYCMWVGHLVKEA